MASLHLPRLVVAAALAVLSCGLVSCAGGPTYAEVKSKLPPIPKGDGRVFVYRPATVGFAVKPSVKIDDKEVGTSKARGFFYSDQKAGSHAISITTEWKHKNMLNVIAGQPCFVECMVTPGVLVGHIIPNQMAAAEGEANIQECKLGTDEFEDNDDEQPEQKPKAVSPPLAKTDAPKERVRDWGNP